jgi:23S rRNA (adenine2503-C2)-methyltransferase
VLLDRSIADWQALLADVAPAPVVGRALRAAWRREVEHPADADGVPKALRAALRERAGPLALPAVREETRADDGTEKLLVALQDGRAVESVLIPDVRKDASRARMRALLTPDARPRGERPKRAAGCISTQVGCGVRCTFCASGREGLVRNLTAGEVVAQALLLRARAAARGYHLATLVVMGMGEPLHNTDALLPALRDLCSPWGGEWGPTCLTVSTVGVPEGLEALAREACAPNIALSLHAPDDPTRARIVPLAPKLPPVRELVAAASRYAQATRRLVTVSYVLLDGVNDDPAQADALAALLEGSAVHHVNLIPWNEVDGLRFAASRGDRAQAFFERLRAAGRAVHLRRARGADQDAACGQLAKRAT